MAYLVETIMAQNGLNIGLHRPNFVSSLSEYVLQTELPRGWEIPKITKFAGDTSESTVEHITCYLIGPSYCFYTSSFLSIGNKMEF